jgi:hypothetical protein
LPYYYFFSPRYEAFHHARENRMTRAIVKASAQPIVHRTAPTLFRMSTTNIPASAYTDAVRKVIMMAATATARANPLSARSSSDSSAGFTFLFQSLADGGGRARELLLRISSFRIFPLHNLVNPLPGKVELVSNLTERCSGGPQFVNSVISWNIRRRPRLEWTPLPTRDSRELTSHFFRKLIFAMSLPHVSDPCSERNFFSINNFYMKRGHSAMPVSCLESPQR